MCCSLEDGQQLTDGEAELGVQGEGPVVVRRLYQPHARDLTLSRSLEQSIHQRTARPRIRCRRVDSDGSDADDLSALVL